MKQSEFLEKFLPDYYKRGDVARLNDLHKYLNCETVADEDTADDLWDMFYSDAFEEFIELQDKLYSEAQQSFADKFGKRQRENCKRQSEQDSIDWAFAKGILNAEQPKIEEL